MAVATTSFSAIGLILIFLAGGGFTGTQGITPLPEDPVVAQIAPPECLFYTSWTGVHQASPDATNSTEQLYNDEKFQAFLKNADKKIREAVTQNVGQQQAEGVLRLLDHLQTHAGAVYVSTIDVHPGKMHDFRGGLVLRVDDDEIQPLFKAVNSLLLQIPHGDQTAVKIGDLEFTRIQVMDRTPTITWGMSGNYLVVGIGEGEAEMIVKRQQGAAADWLVAAKKSVEIPRPASFVHIDIRRLIDTARSFTGEQDDSEIDGLLEAFGIDAIESFSCAGGLDDQGSVNRGLLKLSGELRGIMTLLDCDPLTKEDLQKISSESPFALAFQFSLADALTAFLESCEHEKAPRDAKRVSAMLVQQIDALGAGLGLDIRADLLASIGDTWRIYVQPGSGAFINGWTISVDLADPAKFSNLHEKLLAALQENLGQGGPGKITSAQRGQTKIYFAHLRGLPIVPSWCIHDDRLLICSSPASLTQILSGQAHSTPLADAEHIRPFLEDNSRTIKLVHIDAKAVAEFAIPLIAMRLRTLPQGRQFDVSSLLPPADVVAQHLQSTVFAVERADEGIRITRRGTRPGINAGQAAGLAVAAILPATGQARAAAQVVDSRNNQKQIALALHNFHSVHGAFPAGYNSDAQDKPLLSWRVHILPYLEEQALYNQFQLEEPWDSPHNKKLMNLMPDVFRSPNTKAEAGKTTYLGVSGADGVFVRPQPDSLLGTGMRKITDGTSNTVMTVESTDDRAIFWTKPGDFAPKKDNPQQGLRVDPQHGMSLGFTDGSVRNVPKTIPNKTLKSLFTKSGGEVIEKY
ncbi:MAG: DUF1559 domain-containing protein [Planctomycetes bacterium]|nr:DUF1559 domain-containing protein [Planctomycetota bacterium]